MTRLKATAAMIAASAGSSLFKHVAAAAFRGAAG
jgi:hypothetical protein